MNWLVQPKPKYSDSEQPATGNTKVGFTTGTFRFRQGTFLDQNHCDCIQGYYFSKPLSVDAFEQSFEDGSWRCGSVFLDLAEHHKTHEYSTQIFDQLDVISVKNDNLVPKTSNPFRPFSEKRDLL
jgi:hypothetical protein